MLDSNLFHFVLFSQLKNDILQVCLNYCLQEKKFFISPFRPRCQPENLRVDFIVSNDLSLNSTVSWKIQDSAKLFASLEGRK